VSELPTGTVTLLFTDVENSTELVKGLGERYAATLAEHRDLLRHAFEQNGGVEVDTQGDAFLVAFAAAPAGVKAAVEAQRALAAHSWQAGLKVRVRMGLHTCEPHRSEHGYVGVGVHRGARICTVAHGGQVLLSRSTAGIVDDFDLTGVSLLDLGEHRLKDIEGPERIYQVAADDLPSGFPALRTIDQQVQLSGTVTVVVAEGRRVLRLMRELPSEVMGRLLRDYRLLLRDVLEGHGGHEIEVAADTAVASFPTAREAAVAAVAAQHAVQQHRWPHGGELEISVGIHSGTAGIGWSGPAIGMCGELCDVAEAGEIFLSQVTAGLLEEVDLGELSVKDVGNPTTRKGGQPVRAYELVYPR
jgi:class 3 adenylate cyclase